MLHDLKDRYYYTEIEEFPIDFLIPEQVPCVRKLCIVNVRKLRAFVCWGI